MTPQEKIIGWTILIAVMAWLFVYHANLLGFEYTLKVYLAAITFVSLSYLAWTLSKK